MHLYVPLPPAKKSSFVSRKSNLERLNAELEVIVFLLLLLSIDLISFGFFNNRTILVFNDAKQGTAHETKIQLLLFVFTQCFRILAFQWMRAQFPFFFPGVDAHHNLNKWLTWCTVDEMESTSCFHSFLLIERVGPEIVAQAVVLPRPRARRGSPCSCYQTFRPSYIGIRESFLDTKVSFLYLVPSFQTLSPIVSRGKKWWCINFFPNLVPKFMIIFPSSRKWYPMTFHHWSSLKTPHLLQVNFYLVFLSFSSYRS